MFSKSSSYKFAGISLLVILAANIFYATNWNPLGIDVLLWLATLLPLFGSLLFSQFKHGEGISFSEFFGFSIGSSVFALMALGIGLNSIGLLSHTKTLQPSFLIPSFDVLYILLLLALTLRYRGKDYVSQKLASLTASHIGVLFTVFLLPLLGALGAIRLNNGGSNSLALVVLTFLVLGAGYLTISHKVYSNFVYAAALWAIGTALLLGFSMRSNHIFGYDIHQEYQVFTGTLNAGLWHPNVFNNAYNACLSITVLPTVFAAFLHIPPEYIFKLVMQLIFGVLGTTSYAIFSRQLHGNKKQAFLLAIFVVTQEQFIFEFPALIRQQVALLFFALMLSATVAKLPNTLRKNLIFIFGVGMVVSHYSTSYVCLALLILAYLCRSLFIKLRESKSPDIRQQLKSYTDWHIKPAILLSLVLCTFLWYGLVTNSSGGIGYALSKSVTSLGSYFESSTRSDFVLDTLGVKLPIYNTSTLEHLAQKRQVKGGYNASNYTPTSESVSEPSPRNSFQSALATIYTRLIPLLIKLALVAGVAIIVIRAFRDHRHVNISALMIAASILFVAILVIPNISEFYNVERFYQQILLIASPAILVAVGAVLAKLRRNTVARVTLLSGLLVLAYMVCNIGLAQDITYGSPYVNLSDNNSSFATFYTYDGEVLSMKWLASNRINTKAPVNFDLDSSLTAIAYAPALTNNEVIGLFPSQITKNSYVYASASNLNGYVFDKLNNGNGIVYNFPAQFLQQNKNTIYDDGTSEIYR